MKPWGGKLRKLDCEASLRARPHVMSLLSHTSVSHRFKIGRKLSIPDYFLCSVEGTPSVQHHWRDWGNKHEMLISNWHVNSQYSSHYLIHGFMALLMYEIKAWFDIPLMLESYLPVYNVDVVRLSRNDEEISPRLHSVGRLPTSFFCWCVVWRLRSAAACCWPFSLGP